MKKVIVLLSVVLLVSCTDNARVKKFGGTATINLPVNTKLINITWKETNVWYLTKPMSKSDSAETYNFQEESSLGLVEGTYIIKESKK